MSDFDALVKVDVDDSELTDVEQRLQTLKNDKIPIEISLANAQSDIQNQLDQIAKGLKLNISNVNLGGSAGKAAQQAGQQAGQQFSNAFVNNINVKNGGSQIQALQKTLKSLNFDSSSIKNVTTDLESMDVAVTKIQTNLKGKNLSVKVDGIDSLGRAVTVVKEFDSASGSIQRTSETISQSFEDLNKVSSVANQWQSKLESFKTQFESVLKIGTTSTNSLKQALDGIDFSNISSQSELDNMIAKFKEAEAEGQRLNSLFNKDWASTAIEQIDKNLQDLPTHLVQVEEKFKSLGTLGNEFSNTGNTIRDTISKLRQDIIDLDSVDNPEEKIKSYNEIATTLHTLQNVIKETTAQQKNMFTENDINAYNSKLDNLEKNFKGLGSAGNESLEVIKRLREQIAQLGQSNGTEEQINQYKNIGTQIDALGTQYSSLKAQIESTANSQNLLTRTSTASNSFESWLNSNQKAAKAYREEIEQLRTALQNVTSSTELTSVQAQISNLKSLAKSEGNTGNSWLTTLTTNMTKLSPLFGMGTLVNTGIRALKDMYENVVDIDTAMTELKKVTDETEASYEAFLTSAGNTAQEIGTTVSDYVQSTADFARLGYDFEDSQYLAEVANIYYVVGDEISDIDEATDSIISTMTAFGVEAADSLSIVDKLNEVSNNYAISSGGLGDALSRSASSMAAANNTLDETIALITAA